MNWQPPDPPNMQPCQHCGGDGVVQKEDETEDITCPECDGECVEPEPEYFGY